MSDARRTSVAIEQETFQMIDMFIKCVEFCDYNYAVVSDLEDRIPGFKEFWQENKIRRESLDILDKKNALAKLTDREKHLLGLK